MVFADCITDSDPVGSVNHRLFSKMSMFLFFSSFFFFLNIHSLCCNNKTKVIFKGQIITDRLLPKEYNCLISY